jgi:hypothetical protein
VYALTDTISSHVQLHGPTHSLKSFLMLPQSDSCGVQPPLRSSYPQPVVRVYLLRRVSVDVRGYKASRNTIIGEAPLREIPPTHFSQDTQEATHLDWEGEVRCGQEIHVGGFAANNVVVKVIHDDKILLMLHISYLIVIGLHWHWDQAPCMRA